MLPKPASSGRLLLSLLPRLLYLAQCSSKYLFLYLTLADEGRDRRPCRPSQPSPRCAEERRSGLPSCLPSWHRFHARTRPSSPDSPLCRSAGCYAAPTNGRTDRRKARPTAAATATAPSISAATAAAVAAGRGRRTWLRSQFGGLTDVVSFVVVAVVAVARFAIIEAAFLSKFGTDFPKYDSALSRASDAEGRQKRVSEFEPRGPRGKKGWMEELPHRHHPARGHAARSAISTSSRRGEAPGQEGNTACVRACASGATF